MRLNKRLQKLNVVGFTEGVQRYNLKDKKSTV